MMVVHVIIVTIAHYGLSASHVKYEGHGLAFDLSLYKAVFPPFCITS